MDEHLQFRRCRDFHGNEITLTAGRRNGKPAVFFSPQIECPEPAPEPQVRSANPIDELIDDQNV
jgi:hypothetical protein